MTSYGGENRNGFPFNDLPEDILRKIYKHAFSESTLPEIKNFKLSKLNRIHPDPPKRNPFITKYPFCCFVIQVERKPYYY